MTPMEELYHHVFGRHPISPMSEAEMAAEITQRHEDMATASSDYYNYLWAINLTDEDLHHWLHRFDPKFTNDGGGMVLVLREEQNDRNNLKHPNPEPVSPPRDIWQ